MRILLNPEAGEGGGTEDAEPEPKQGQEQANQAKHQEPKAEASEPKPEPNPEPKTVSLTVDEYQRYREAMEKYNEAQKQQEERLKAEEQQKAKALADKEGVEAALEKVRKDYEDRLTTTETKYRDTQNRLLAAEKQRAISSALGGYKWAGDDPQATANFAASQLAGEFEARLNDNGEVKVVEAATGRPAADVIRERLQHPTYKLLLLSDQKGGSGATDAEPGPPAQEEKAKSAGEMMIEFERNRAKQSGKYSLVGRNRTA